MKHSTLFCSILLSVVLIASQLSTSSAWQFKNIRNSTSTIQRQFSKGHEQSWKSRARNSLWKAKIFRRPSLSLPSKLIRKQLAQTTKNLLYNPSDPLHAYPNQVDLVVHSLFQRVATFEINNAATVRSALDSARVVFWVGLAMGAVGLAVPLAATALPILARRRSSTDGIDEEDDHHSPEYWNFVDQMAQSVISALQNGQIKYQL